MDILQADDVRQKMLCDYMILQLISIHNNNNNNNKKIGINVPI